MKSLMNNKNLYAFVAADNAAVLSRVNFVLLLRKDAFASVVVVRIIIAIIGIILIKTAL